MQKDFATLGDLTVAFGIPCIKILSIDVAEEANQHGVMTLEAVIAESVTQDDVLCCEDSVIAVMGAEGKPIFSGYVSEIYLSHTAQYQELFVTAYSSSIRADRSRESETFQSEGKTLAQVARVVMEPLGIQLSIPQDVALPQMLSRENETAWEFVRRIANEQGIYLYVDSKSLTPHISIGLAPFSVFPYDCFQFKAERKSISDYLAIQTSTGKQISAFQTAEQRGVTRELQIGAGYELVGETREYAVVRSRIQNDGDLLVNELTLTDPIGEAPKDGKSTLLQSTVLTGSVLAVQGVEVLVKFDKDGPAAGTRWIPYENTINNYFYCMPSEGDKVFAYYQNDGTIICLGSKWGQDLLDFADHKDHMLVNQSHMIKAGTKRLDFVLDRDYLKPEHYQKTHISFVQDKGIEIASTGSIEIEATEEICISSRPVDWQDSGEVDQMIQSKNDAFTSGEENYQSHGGDGSQTPPTEAEKSAAARLLYVNMMGREFKNNIVVSTVMNFFGGASDSEVENTEEALQEPFSSGIVNMCASEYMELVVGTSNIQMTSNGFMTFSAEAYDMYGKERKNYERVELENYTARDKFLDGLQAVLGVVSIAAWLIPAPAGPIIAIAADIADAAISINRGDMLGAGLACCGVIGDVAKGLGMVDKATTAGKALNAANKALGGAEVAQKAGRIENIFGVASMVAIPVSIAQNGYALYQDVQAEGWTTENKNKFDALMYTAVRQGAQMLLTTSLKNKVDAVTGSRTRASEGDGAPPAKSGGGSGDGGDGGGKSPRPEGDGTPPAKSGGGSGDGGDGRGKSPRLEGDSTPPAKSGGGSGDGGDGGGKRPKSDGEKGPEGQRKNTEDQEGDPVDPITGSFTAEQTDFILPDIVGQFRLMRRHESMKRHERQLLGDRWLSSIGMRLDVQGDRAIMLKEDLYEEHFKRTEEGWVNCWGGTQAYVLREDNTGYKIMENTNGKTYCYNHGGYLTAVIDSHGNRMEITYCGTTIQRLTLASGQYLDFSYAAGKVSKITDRVGRSVSYEYDGEYLIAVTYPNGGTMRYEYDHFGMIISVTDQNGIRYLKNSYDEKGRVTKQDIANGEEHVFLYRDGERQTIYINTQSGRRTIYHYNERKQPTKTEYDDGTTKEFAYDQWGNKILEKSRDGSVNRWTYRQDGKLLRQELPGGLVWEYEYDGRGNLIHWWNNGGEEFFAQFDAHNNCVREEQVIDAVRRRVQTYQYDRLGRMISMTDGNGNVTRHEYWENSSRVSRLTTPEGSVFQYRYDQIEQCMAIQSEAGEVQFGYTKLGARALEIDPLGNTTRYRYDLLSNLIAKVLPNQYDEKTGDGSCYRYEYDAMDHRIRSTDPLGNVFATPHDTAGRLSMEVNPNTYDPATKSGQGVRYVYDTDDRRIKVVYPDGGIRRLKYDAMGNLVKVIEPEQYDPQTDDGAGYTYRYDAANRLVEIINPTGVVEKKYLYNLRGLVVKEISADGYLAGATDEERVGVLYRYNVAGWLLEKREPVYRAEGGAVQYRLTQYTYDANGNRTEEKRFLSFQDETSARGSIHTLTFGYDKQNRLVRVSDGLGAVVHYGYDGLNRRTRETRLLSEGLTQRIDYRYDAAGRLVEVQQSADPEGCGSYFASIRYEYDRNGNLTRILLPAGGEVLREYDAANRLTAEVHQEEASGIHNRTEFSYDAAGNLTEITDNQGRKTRIAYDLLNREIRRIERDGGVQRTIYDRNGQVVRLIRPNEYNPETDGGEGFQFTYDAQGRVLTVLSPDGHVLQSNTYDGAGRLLQRVDGVGSGVKYEYDFAGAQRRMESMGGASQELEYDAQGRITGIVDGNGNETKYLLDEWGRITGVRKADGSTERYAYNFAGDIVSSTDGEGHTTRYEYNRMGKISAIVDPTGEKESYHYNGQGRLVRKIDRNGVTVELGYNLYGAPLFRKEKDGALGDFYEYTPEGLLKCAISEGMRYAYEYDEMGRLARKSASGRTLLALTYDKNGNKISQTDVSGKTTQFAYFPLDLLEKVWDDGRELAAYTYNPDGTPKAVTHGPIRQEYVYDLDKNLTGLTVHSGDTLLAQTSYTYDGNGNRVCRQALDGTTLYQYDALNQLKKVEYPSYAEELFYDKAGNRTRRLVAGEEELYQYDPRNRLMALTRGGVTTPFQYDNAGNLLVDDKARYSYDAFNRTAKVETFDGHVQVNRYDAEGLRHEMEENGRLVRFIFHKGEVVAEQEENSNVIRLIRSSELIARSSDSESARTYYHYASDEMGSTTHIVDENGNVKNRYEYDAWGKITAKEEAVPNRFTYYGQQIDSITQQYYLRARFYNPVIGRFTQEDTYRGDGLNLYAYCHSNPIYYTDPSGFSTPSVVHSNNPEVMDIMQSTTQFLQGVSGERVGAVPSSDNFNTWFDSLTVDQLKILMTDNKVKERITQKLRLGDRHEWLMVSNAVISKSWGLSAYDIQTLTNYTSEVYFLNVKNKAGAERSGFHTGTSGSILAHMGPEGIDKMMKTSSSLNEFKLKLNIWADEHLVLATSVGIFKGRKMLPGRLIATDAELERYKVAGLNPSPRAIYDPN